MDSRQQEAVRAVRCYLETRKGAHDLISEDDTIHTVFPGAPEEKNPCYLTVSDLEELVRLVEMIEEVSVSTPVATGRR
jgi:hypothetical protein